MSGERPEADDLGELYGALSREMILDADLSLSDLRLGAYIGIFDRRSLETGKGKGCLRSIANLARDLGMSKRQALRSVEKLVRKGYVRKTPRGQSWQGYILQIVYAGGDTAVTTPGDTGVTTHDTAVTTPVTQVAPCDDMGVTHKREGIDNLKEDDDDQPISGLSYDDVDAVIQRWRDVAEPAGAVEIRRVTAPRKALIASAIAENGLSDVLAAIDRLSRSKWAMGKGERGWRAKLEWALEAGRVNAILEGQHDDFKPVLREESGDGLVQAIRRRMDARNAETGEGGDEFSRAARRWAGRGDALTQAINRWANLSDDPRDGFTRALHRDLQDQAHTDRGPVANYVDFTEIDDEAP